MIVASELSLHTLNVALGNLERRFEETMKERDLWQAEQQKAFREHLNERFEGQKDNIERALETERLASKLARERDRRDFDSLNKMLVTEVSDLKTQVRAMQNWTIDRGGTWANILLTIGIVAIIVFGAVVIASRAPGVGH